MYVYVCMYIYIYIYTHRPGELLRSVETIVRDFLFAGDFNLTNYLRPTKLSFAHISCREPFGEKSKQTNNEQRKRTTHKTTYIYI